MQESYEAFSPRAGDGHPRVSSTSSWIDAELRPGKRGGAFSSSAVPSVHPYILMNFTDKLRDVMTLAHELGHGLHQYLSRGVGYLQCDTPLTTAETASVFGEMLTFQRLLQLYPEPGVRLALLCSKIEDGFRHGVSPGGADALRAIPARGPAQARRTDDGADQRTVDGRESARCTATSSS